MLLRSFDIPLKQIHWDLTSFHFTGEYENQKEDFIKITYTKNHPQENAEKSVKIGLDVAKDEYGQVPIYYEGLNGNASGISATISNMEKLKKHLKCDNIIRINDRGCFSPEVAIKTKNSGFDFISSITFSESYKELFFECEKSGIAWQKLSYLSINQQKKKDEKERDYYYGFETTRTIKYEGKSLDMRVIFINSDGKAKRNKKTESKRLSCINNGFEKINSKIGHPHYRTIKEVKKRIEVLLGKYPAYGKLYSYKILEDEKKKPIKVTYSMDEEKLKENQMLYGVYVIGTSLKAQEYPIDKVFSLFKEQYVVENANKILKGPVKLRPIFLHRQERIESLILVIFIALMLYYLIERAYCYHQKKKEEKELRKLKKTTTRELFWRFNTYSLGIMDIGNQKIVKPSELDSYQQEVFDILGLPPPTQWLLK